MSERWTYNGVEASAPFGVTPGWPNPDDAKTVMRSAFIASGATEQEFNAALLGVLSTMIGPAQWTEATVRAMGCFRDRRRP